MSKITLIAAFLLLAPGAVQPSATASSPTMPIGVTPGSDLCPQCEDEGRWWWPF